MAKTRIRTMATAPSLSGASAVHRDLIRIGRAVRSRSGDGPLSAGQMSALWTITQHAPIRATELADREGVAAPTMSRVVAWLERHDMVVRTADPSDRRVCLLTPTTAGIEFIKSASSRKSQLFEVALNRLDTDDRESVERCMRLLADTLCDLTPRAAAHPGSHPADDATTEEET